MTMIEKLLNELGISHFGMAQIPPEYRPFPLLPHAVSLGVPLSKTIVASIQDAPTPTYFHTYRTTNAFLDQTALRLVLEIERSGHNAVYVPASQTVDTDGIRGLFSHKMAAVLSGLGGIGQNALFISNKYGPALRLSTVLTDYPVPPQNVSNISGPPENLGLSTNPCTNCGICVQKCPCGALTGTSWKPGVPRDEILDAKKCSNYMKKAYRDIGRGAVCGICMAVCPLSFGK